ncbi:endo-1,4-beta-xylanase [Halocalculus aciditolerans]|uniref:endo-1,4-beta-xylanase n=1 Tax=Halocalculus aciditolerans TaxID=1383812 RepID=UPI00166C3B09|nr:endo-1,4-beta-xylanase [Halocalculus aciditolerans]
MSDVRPETTRRWFVGGLAAALAGCSTRERADSTTERPTTVGEPPDGSRSWEDAADARIDEHRRSDVAVVVRRDGERLSGASVDVTLDRHAFDFSTAYNVAKHFDVGAGSPYRESVADLFNEAVFENAYKWRRWTQAGAHERADRIIAFLRDHDVSVAGAPVVWQTDSANVLPEEVWAALDAGDDARLRSLVTDHVETILGHYVEDHDVTEWVFLNEPVGHHLLTDALSDAPAWRSPVLREWFHTAGEAAPGATLAVNEYDILTLDRPRHRDRYATLIQYLLADDAPLDEVAFQAHAMGESERVTPAEQWRRLERFAGLGDVDLVVSEFDTPGFDSDEVAGRYLYRFLKLCYSHPAMAGFRLWGFWDGQHWRDDAPLFYEDWTPKPGYDAYVDLVFDEWFTEESGTTDGAGAYRTRADLGTYAVSVAADGQRVETTRTVTNPDGETTWTIDL